MSEQTVTQPEAPEVALAEFFTAERYTPYAMAVVVNKVLEAAGVAKSVPPQMLYQYTSAKKRYIPVVEEDGKRYVEREVAQAWTEAYLLKQLAA